MKAEVPVETFPPLTELPFIHHAFTLRTAADTKSDDFQPRLLHSHGYRHYAAAEQTHGDGVAVVTQAGNCPGVDALITGKRDLPLVIRCADCAAVFIVDRKTPAIALIHSGKKGTLLNIVGATVTALQESFGTNPADCRALISPCIGPCHYELDLWSHIAAQLQAAGIRDIHNPRTCTACHLDRYFSYRAERGQTGRMFAMLTLK